MANGMRGSTYGMSAVGTFEIDGDGTYRSLSYPAKGPGRARANNSTVTFEGGELDRSIGQAGVLESGGFYIRFSEGLTKAPLPSTQFNDHMCYRKQQP